MLQVPESTTPAPLAPGVRVRQATSDDLMALRPLNSGGEPPKRRFARGDTALVAELDGCLVGCQWISDAPMTVPYLRVSVDPRPGARYCYGFYVRPEVRRRGIGRALEQALLQEADRTGVRAYWCHVDGFNRVSLAVHRSVGWRPAEESRGLVLLNRYGVTLWRRAIGSEESG